MKLENFEWQNSIYIKINDLELDMHNCYDFISINYKPTKREIVLIWNLGKGDWVDQLLPKQVILTVTGVSKLQVNPRDLEMPFTEDDCLASFGYLSDDSWVDGQFWPDGEADPHWWWSLEFQSGAEFIIDGDCASVALKP